MRTILDFIIDWVWQLPQNLLGLCWKYITKNRITSVINNEDIKCVRAVCYLLKRYSGAVTLGKYMFVSERFTNIESVVRHECGHVVQSRMLGPLYLLVIGLPSILHAWMNGYLGCCKSSPDGYYHFYTERWANRIMDRYHITDLQEHN